MNIPANLSCPVEIKRTSHLARAANGAIEIQKDLVAFLRTVQRAQRLRVIFESEHVRTRHRPRQVFKLKQIARNPETLGHF